jgi:hypothetical protein
MLLLLPLLLQQLEAEKQQLQQLPLQAMDTWQQKRHAAAARIQAVWRGKQQRTTLRLQHPQLVGSRGTLHCAWGEAIEPAVSTRQWSMQGGCLATVTVMSPHSCLQ